MNATIRDQFFELVGNRDTEWLEVASTLLSLRESLPGQNITIRTNH